MLRTGYTTRVRPWRDDGGDVEIRWYKCAPGAKALPYPSLFRSLHWEAYPYLFANGKGEVFNSPVKVYPYKSPPGVTGQDHCGTETDFSRGGHYDPVSPPYPRGADGIALCCRPDLGCLLVDGIGAAAPGYVSPFNSTGFTDATGTTISSPVPAFAGLTGVTVVSAGFVVTVQAAVWVGTTPGEWYRIPLASRDTGLTWKLLWWDGGPMFGLFVSAPVNHEDSFLAQAPAFGFRLIVAQDGGGFLTTSEFQIAPHRVPPPPP